MTPQTSTLAQCVRAAERVEFAADRLGTAWPGYAPILQECHEFRRACEQLATNRGFSEVTIAFVGPKKAGKSTVAGLLVNSDEKRERLKAGQRSSEATAKPTWIAAKPPAFFDAATEEFIPCHQSELAPLGAPYALLDVPGSNEADPTRRQLATRALDHAVIKVLVVDRRAIESSEITRYLEGAAAAPILPVINQIRHDEDGADFSRWVEDLQQRYPHVLPRIEIRDWEVAGHGQEQRAAARETLMRRLSEEIAGRAPATLAEPQLARKMQLFEAEIARLARTHLPATAAALGELQDALSRLPSQAIASLLGSERLVAANVRMRFRAILLERTPIFLFPWRLALSIANLVHGATDRLPLVFLGSVPSMLTTAWAAAKNVKEAREFAAEAGSGLRNRVAVVVKEMAGPQLQAIDHALRREIGATETTQTGVSSTARLRGIETLQARSTELFQEVVEKFAPARPTAWALALIGFGMFWAVFGWPVFGLYQDFAVAASEVLARRATAITVFPSGTFSMLLTSALLALLPMGLFLLCAVSFLTRRARVLACARALRAAHESEVERMSEQRQIEVEISEPQIDACAVLLRIGGGK